MTPPCRLSYTRHHMNSGVKQLELLVYGVRITANVNVQADYEQLYRIANQSNGQTKK